MHLAGRCCLVLTAALVAGPAAAQQPGIPRHKPDPFEAARERMVRDDIAAGGVTDERVLAAMRATPRHEFVPGPQRNLAYFDMSLPIGEAQTISGPFVVAYMTEKLEPRPTDKVLEIGTGSGYQAAVLSPLVATVYSIEINEKLGEKAAKTLARLGYKNVVTKIGDGFRGWPEHAPFDKIIVTCSPEDVPRPLVEQLAEGGRMVIPVGERYDQTLVLLTKRGGKLEREALVPSLFVPMTGAAEQGRRIQPDGSRPALENGGFESLLQESSVPTAWYYPRQMELVEAGDACEGRRYLRLENAEPGRPAHVFQGFPVDGREVARLTVRARVRAESLRPGLVPDEAPAIAVKFFDAERSRSARSLAGGPWQGTFPWREAVGTVPVPTWAREAILQIGMLGGTGRLEVDAVSVDGSPR
ncbi:MAG: protein-L-isoaspartate(D-aspartate) O-methyltransferase [Planctomycetia bacterium]|nr:protein-L-isoaspartate(D-aspartate) O-methyltransferase [Planctomycetia bacterium]